MITSDLTMPDRSLLGLVVTQLPQRLLVRPLDYLLAEHMRLRAVCSLLRYAGEVCQLDAETARAVTRFLNSVLPLHRDDEERDLFPALLRSARPGDELGGTIRRLEEDHRALKGVQDEIIEVLACEAGEHTLTLSRMSARLMRDFAEAERRHVAVENGIVLAIARARINLKDLADIAAAMIARREAAA